MTNLVHNCERSNFLIFSNPKSCKCYQKLLSLLQDEALNENKKAYWEYLYCDEEQAEG